MIDFYANKLNLLQLFSLSIILFLLSLASSFERTTMVVRFFIYEVI